jgi:TetR/AcrR family tetracycline transcriptional repressor
MAKIRRSEVVIAALDLLNEVGLDGLSTRRLAERLGVESSALYWHFSDKASLLNEMASFAVAKHHSVSVPEDTQRWAAWFADNARAFRATLMAYRDGARLHAGSTPDASEMARILPKLDYLFRVGVPRHEALMALLAAGQFTLGCVMDAQARPSDTNQVESELEVFKQSEPHLAKIMHRVHRNADAAFEFGLQLIIDGLQHKIAEKARRKRIVRKRE